MAFNVSDYWNKRLDSNFSLKGVGYISFSTYYNNWLYKSKKVVLDKILKTYLGDVNGKSILDIGCGTGYFVDYYTNRKAVVTGLDITTVSVENLSKKYPGLKFYCKDISSTTDTMLSEKFDVVNMWDVIYHQVDEEAFFNTLTNIASMCQPGAIFMTTDTFGAPVASRKVNEHVVFRSMEAYEKHMNQLGFELKRIYPLYRWMNRPYRWGTKLTNYLAPILFMFDRFSTQIPANNLSTAVWQYKK